MKKLLVTLAIMMLAIPLSTQAASWAVEVSTNNVVIAPALAGYTTIPNTNGTIYAAGDYVAMPNERDYWTPNGGTYLVSQAPTHSRGIVESLTGIKWLAIRSSRKNIEIQTADSGDVWISRQYDAVVDECTLLNGKGAARQYSLFSGEMNAISGTGTNTVVVQEW